MESFKDKFTKWKISNSGENVIAFRKFGHKVFYYLSNYLSILNNREYKLSYPLSGLYVGLIRVLPIKL